MSMTSRARSVLFALPVLAFLIRTAPAFAGGDSVFSPGHDDALNAICGEGRTGRSWNLDVAEPAAAGAPGAMVETVVPAAGRTEIVRILPGAIVPCIFVMVATDAMGMSAYDLAVDAVNVNRDFLISDIHTGEPLLFCPGTPTAAVLARALSPAGFDLSGGINRGHVTGLNALCGNGRSGRSWSMGESGALSETVVPAVQRTDIVRIMPNAIVPCVRVKVATDEGGRTRYELAVDAANVNRDFRITDIHTGEFLQLCRSPR